MSSAPIRAMQVGFILGVAALAYSFVGSARDGELRRTCTSLCALGPNYAGDNRVAPDIQLTNIDGTPARLSDLRGKTVVLVFWSSSCSVCKKQMPSVAHLAQEIKNDPRYALMTVAVDESADEVRKVMKQHAGSENPFPVALDPDSKWVMDRYGTKLFPETWIIDPSGVIRARFDGARDWSSSLALDVIDEVATGGVCPMDINGQNASGEGVKLCRSQQVM